MPSRLTDDELARLIGSRLLRLEEYHGAQRIELTHDVLTGVVREHRDRRRAEEEKAVATTDRVRRSSRPRNNASKPNSRRSASTRRRFGNAPGFWSRCWRSPPSSPSSAGFLYVKAEPLKQNVARRLAAGSKDSTPRACWSAPHQAGTRRLSSRSWPPGTLGQLHRAPRRRTVAPLHRGGPTGQHPQDHHRPHRCGERCGVQPRRAPAGQRQRRRTVRLWNADTGQPIGDPLTGHTDAVCGVAFSPDGHRLATRQRRQHGAAVERRHRPTHRRPAHRPHRTR